MLLLRPCYVNSSEPLRQALKSEQQQGIPDEPTIQEVHFQRILSGRMAMRGAESVDFSTYRAEDGTSLELRIETYRSATQAEDRIEALIKTATRVVERAPRLDSHGVALGERVVLVLGQSRAAVAWTEKQKVHIVESAKLNHTLAFEKQMAESRRQ
jgi:hypothetical protein